MKSFHIIASVLILFTCSMPRAQTVEDTRWPTHIEATSYPRLTAFLAFPLRSPAEIDVLFKGNPIANISLHGTTVTSVGFILPDLFVDCADFEANVQHLEVFKNSVKVAVARFALESAGGATQLRCSVGAM